MTSEKPARPELASELRIAAVETIPVRVPLGRVYRGSHYQMTHRSTIITRVITEDGIVGEAYAGDEDAGLTLIDRIIREEVAPAVIGTSGLAVERCAEAALPATYDILRDHRLGLVARASVDLAIWDAIGKHLGQPLWRLWGGYTDRLPMITIGGYYDSPVSIEDEIGQVIGRGMAGMKFKVGGLDPEADAERVLRARRAAGSDFVLAADANQGYTIEQAIEFVRLAEEADLYWFEEPSKWQNDRRAMASVRARSGVAVCAGQSEMSGAGCRDLMVDGAIDFCNFDSSWSGGPTEWRRVAGMAAIFDVRMAHHEEPQVSAHLLASIPHGTFVECFEPDRDPIWWNLISNPPPVSDGYLHLSERPGLGWELDEDYIEHFRLKETG